MKNLIRNGSSNSFSFKWQVVEAVLQHFLRDIFLFQLVFVNYWLCHLIQGKGGEGGEAELIMIASR